MNGWYLRSLGLNFINLHVDLRYREIFDRDIGSSFDIGEINKDRRTNRHYWSLSWPLCDTAKKLYENILNF